MLYRRDAITAGSTVVLVEGEFDALVLLDRVSAVVPVATSGTASARQREYLASAAKVVLAFDADEAGDHAATAWKDYLGDKAVRLRPAAHDVTDMVLAGMSLSDWLAEAIE